MRSRAGTRDPRGLTTTRAHCARRHCNPVRVRARFAAPMTRQESRRGETPSAAEGEAPCDPRVVEEPEERQAPGREPRGRELQRQRGQRREPRAPATEPGRAGVPKADQRDGARAPAREQASGRARNRSASPGVASRPARVEEGERIQDDFGSKGEAVPTKARVHPGALRRPRRPGPPPTAQGTRCSRGGSGRRSQPPTPAAEPRARPGEPRWSKDSGPETRCPGRPSGREPGKPIRGQARGAVRPDRRADPGLFGAADRELPAPVGGDPVRCEQGAAARWARARPFAVTQRRGIAWMVTGSERERPPGRDHELPGPR